jgi:undecaprenyl-diphosphatase
MTLLDALILGIVEGITEFLPISSTGHLVLTGHLLGLPATEFVKSFEIVIQLGAMLAVLALYFRSFLNIQTLKNIVVAFIPTALVGFTVYPYIKSSLLGNPLVVVISLFVGGVLLILFELFHKERTEHDEEPLSYRNAALIGLAQSVAIIPGVSRSGATIIGGLALGLSRKKIVEFSFLLAVPTIGAASMLDLLQSYQYFAAADIAPLAVGFIVSFFVALLSIKILIAYLQNRSFIIFGVYRIVLAIGYFFFVLA